MVKTVNSLSGGKTSSYIAVHYPADLELFALCCIDDHNAAGGKIDKKMKQLVNDRLQKYCPHYAEFVATSEDPKILKVILDLEQLIGREIIWLRGMGWEQMLKAKMAIPNLKTRFCTTILKMIPIFEYLYKYHEFPVKMRLGYRYDEKERMDNFDVTFRHPVRCDIYPSRESILEETGNHVLYNAAREHPNGTYSIHRRETFTWRTGEFVLIEDRITHPRIQAYWKDKGIDFPEDSNCQNCFWKDPAQLRKNFDTNPSIMLWSAVQEVIYGHTFKKEMSMLQMRELGIQLDFFFGTGVGCKGGFCTN